MSRTFCVHLWNTCIHSLENLHSQQKWGLYPRPSHSLLKIWTLSSDVIQTVAISYVFGTVAIGYRSPICLFLPLVTLYILRYPCFISMHPNFHHSFFAANLTRCSCFQTNLCTCCSNIHTLAFFSNFVAFYNVFLLKRDRRCFSLFYTIVWSEGKFMFEGCGYMQAEMNTSSECTAH